MLIIQQRQSTSVQWRHVPSAEICRRRPSAKRARERAVMLACEACSTGAVDAGPRALESGAGGGAFEPSELVAAVHRLAELHAHHGTTAGCVGARKGGVHARRGGRSWGRRGRPGLCGRRRARRGWGSVAVERGDAGAVESRKLVVHADVRVATARAVPGVTRVCGAVRRSELQARVETRATPSASRRSKFTMMCSPSGSFRAHPSSEERWKAKRWRGERTILSNMSSR